MPVRMPVAGMVVVMLIAHKAFTTLAAAQAAP